MDTLLNTLKQDLKNLFSQDLYATWFQPLQAEKEPANNQWTLIANSDFAAVWLRNNYGDLLQRKVSDILGHPIRLEIKALPTDEATREAVKDAPVSVPSATETHAPTKDGLLPQYTFDTFVVGAGNQLAHAAATAVANAPGKAYNPLFIYGNTGLGKTHLTQAIGHFVRQHQPNAKVIYITTERFTNEFIQAIQDNRLTQFRRKYRKTDVLLIDDIHFLAHKERIQEEFFHTFNELFEAQKQLVLCSDRPASEIASLESRLVSRFQWGLV